MVSSKLRGHGIVFIKGEWLYNDTKIPTINNERDCGECERSDTVDGHDGCIGTLPNVMNACCGHGIISEAYIQYWDGHCLRGQDAFNEMWMLNNETINKY